MSDQSVRRLEVGVALALIAIGAAYRVLPHPQNVAPVAATALFAGAALPPALAFTVPVLAMIASDILIGPHDLFWLTWSAFALTGFLGLWIRRPGRGVLKYAPARITTASIVGSTFYFGVTNLGVFLFENMYPKTWAGLSECFVMALPFYRNTLIGALLFSAGLFSVHALATDSSRLRTSSASPRT